jgi:hypothetical protein
MHWRAVAVAAAGLAVTVAAESVSYLPEEPGLAAADAIVGLAFIGLGVVASERRPSSRSGFLMAATGFAWLAGSFASAVLFLHRGPLVHLLLGYPRGRLRSRLEQVVVGAAYVDGAVYPLARQDLATIVLSLAVAAVALVGCLRAGGPERRARAAALVAASAVALALGLGAIARIADAGTDTAGLWAYQAVLVLVAVGLFADLLWGRWTQAAITGLVVDLGEPEQAGTLRAKLARAVGDPSLVVAYRLPDADGYVDETGRPVTLPATGANRTVTWSSCSPPASSRPTCRRSSRCSSTASGSSWHPATAPGGSPASSTGCGTGTAVSTWRAAAGPATCPGCAATTRCWSRWSRPAPCSTSGSWPRASLPTTRGTARRCSTCWRPRPAATATGARAPGPTTAPNCPAAPPRSSPRTLMDAGACDAALPDGSSFALVPTLHQPPRQPSSCAAVPGSTRSPSAATGRVRQRLTPRDPGRAHRNNTKPEGNQKTPEPGNGPPPQCLRW